MVTISDYRLAVTRIQERAATIERELCNVPALEILSLVLDIQADYNAIVSACPLHNMTAYYREIMQDVAEGLTAADKAAMAAIECGFRFIRR